MAELLSLNRMARRLHVSQKWLKEEADAGRVPCLPAGTKYLFNSEAVEQALAATAAQVRREKGVHDAKSS